MPDSPKKTGILISPSGKMYGSEQVLLDFLAHTTILWIVYVPEKTPLFDFLTRKKHNTYQLKGFNKRAISRFYLLKIIPSLCCKNITTVYVNEGGHIQYLRIVAKLFFLKKFGLHLRLLQDVKKVSRLPALRNITLFTPTMYLAKELKGHWKVFQLYDLISGVVQKTNDFILPHEGIIHISIIGRVEISKGSSKAFSFIEYVRMQHPSFPIHFHFFGDLSEEFLEKSRKLEKGSGVKVSFHGFQILAKCLYQSPLVLHFCPTEAMGRVFLESIQRGCLFLGPKSGGIQEIATLLGLSDFLFDDTQSNWKGNLFQMIKDLKQSRPDDWLEAQKKYPFYFSPQQYCAAIENKICY